MRQKLQVPNATATLVFAREPTVLEAVVNWERPSGKRGRLDCDPFTENVFSTEILVPKPSGIAFFQSRAISQWLAGREIVQVPNTFWWVTEARIWGSLFERSRSNLKIGKVERKNTNKPMPLLPLSSAREPALNRSIRNPSALQLGCVLCCVCSVKSNPKEISESKSVLCETEKNSQCP